MNEFRVPAVDIGPYVAGADANEKAAVAAAVDNACREVGFIQIHGHGIAPATIADLTTAMDEFFAQSTQSKNGSRRPREENRGYSPPKSESLSLSLGVESASRMNDFFEAYNVGRSTRDYRDVPADVRWHYAANTWPEIGGFQDRVMNYFAEAERVAVTMTNIFADALGLPATYFRALTDHSINVLRMNNYALPEGTEVALDGDLTGMGEHTDYGLVTILWADQVPGLQVLGADGIWHEVSPEDGALLINLGDLTARLTNERWLSTLHRVKPPIVDNTIARRRSAAFFHDGNADAVIAPLGSCVDEQHPAVYSAVTVDEHIRAKLAGSRAGVRNVGARRESARVLASRR
ncbi:isopenicillin N synthase family dioxygenase [Mycobacterium sp. NPDC003449]